MHSTKQKTTAPTKETQTAFMRRLDQTIVVYGLLRDSIVYMFILCIVDSTHISDTHSPHPSKEHRFLI